MITDTSVVIKFPRVVFGSYCVLTVHLGLGVDVAKVKCTKNSF